MSKEFLPVPHKKRIEGSAARLRELDWGLNPSRWLVETQSLSELGQRVGRRPWGRPSRQTWRILDSDVVYQN